jgi:uncharacterized protein (TIGR02466 family)
MLPNRENLISENLYLLNEPELEAIKAAVHDALGYFASEVMGISQELYVTQSWSLTNLPGAGMHSHAHANSIVSGTIYYCRVPTPAPKMLLERFRAHQQLQLPPTAGKANLYNAFRNAVIPASYDMVLFSSDLAHMVESNQSSEPRHAIAFNSFVKGKIGDYRDVSELILS